MKRFRHTRLLTAAGCATGIALTTMLGPIPAAASDTGLTRQFSADLHGDVTTTGTALAACTTPRDCPDSATARLELPQGARAEHARLLWATGLGDDCPEPEPVPTRPRLGVTTDAGHTGTGPAEVTGESTGDRTAEADVTTVLRDGQGPATVSVSGLRTDGCAAGWSLTVVYELPGSGYRHVVVHSGAAAASTVTMDGFRHFGRTSAHLSSTVYGEADAAVNGVRVESATNTNVTNAEVPADVIAAGDTTAAIGFSGPDLLVQQVALSVPVRDLRINATATPTRIGPGSTVVSTVTVTNDGAEPVPGASFRVDLSRALDDATRPFDITASSGRPVFAGETLKWTGDVAADGTVTVSYSMTVKNPRPGDGRLETVVIGGTGSNCSARDPAAECSVKLRFPPQPNVDADDTGTAASSRLPVTGTSLPSLAGFAAVVLLAGAALRLAARPHRSP